MNKIKQLSRRNIKLIIALLIFVSIGAGVTYSATTYLYNSNVIGYDNSDSGLTATDVQGALDELYTKCQSSGDGDHVCYEKTNVLSVISQGAVSDGIRSTYVNSDTGIDFGAISSDTNGKGVYIRAGTVGTPNPIYYYRGAVTNNNVIFANFCWKIVRTTETGGIKLIYNGIPSSGQCNNTTGASTILGDVTFDNLDYGNATIKTYIDNWYASNMTAYTSYLEDTVWCNDKSGAESYIYGAYTRLYNGKNPSLDCPLAADKYTVNSANGNGLLTYPIALITADEAAFAGAVWNISNTSFYLYNNYSYWLLSPAAYWGASYGSCFGGTMIGNSSYGSGSIYSPCIGTLFAARPAVSLKSGTTFAYGNGTAESPYVVATETENNFNCPPEYECNKKIDINYQISKDAVSDAVRSTYVNSDTGINFGASSSDTNGKGLYLRAGTELTGHPIYYYRGAVDNNYVIFANFCWRIVRTTETGGIKLVYHSPAGSFQCPTSTSDAYIALSAYNTAYSSMNYMANSSTSSTIKTVIDNWYVQYMTNYTSYLEDTVWCNDTTGGAVARLINSKTPTFDCTLDSDKYTVSSVNGNGLLTYPVALLTADEVAFAGGLYLEDFMSFYLYSGLLSWTMTAYNSSYAFAYGEGVDSITNTGVNVSSRYARPAISLKPSTTFITGNGTASNPYVVATS